MFEGNWLNIFVAEKMTPILTKVSFTDGKCNWFLLLVLKSCNNELVLKLSKLLNINIINEKIYKRSIGKIFSFTSQPLQEHLGPIPNIVLNIFFFPSLSSFFHSFFLNYKLLMCCSWIAPEYYTIFYQGMKMSKMYNLLFLYVINEQAFPL